MIGSEAHFETLPVRLSAVTKVYGASRDGVPAVDDVSFEVSTGEMVALTGPSGCGKSTLLALVGCVDRPTSGVVTIEGQATTTLSDSAMTLLRRTRVGTVFQFFNLLPTMTVAENIGVPLVLQGHGRFEILDRVSAALEAVGLERKARSYPDELSGGEAQRVAIARATIHGPAVVLADEPTGNLDSRNAMQVMQLFRELAFGGQSILLASHSNAAASLCDRVICMQDGRVER